MIHRLFTPESTAVIVVDVQADFTEAKSGALAVPGTDEPYIEMLNRATRHWSTQGYPLFFTQDWHPPDHISFYTSHPGTKPLQVIEISGRTQVMWPPHCVQNSPGADILIPMDRSAAIIRKGTDARFDSYSGFADDGGRATELRDLLQREQISRVIIYGLATDYCVKATALDALARGYAVLVLLDLSRGVNNDTTEAAVQTLKQQGAILGNFAEQSGNQPATRRKGT